MVSKLHSVLEAQRGRLSVFWQSSWGIWLLVALLLVGLYFVAISKLAELVVGGFRAYSRPCKQRVKFESFL